MEVVGLFEIVRRALQQQNTNEWVPPEPKRDPMPFWGYMPFGAPQFGNKRLGPGLVVATLQAAFGGLSIGMHVHVNAINRAGHPDKWTEEEFSIQVTARRYGVQWPATFAFYATWIGSSTAAALRWRAKNRQQTQVSIQPTPHYQGLVVTTQF